MASKWFQQKKIIWKLQLLRKNDTLAGRLCWGISCIMLARYAILPIMWFLYCFWRNWLYTSNNPEVWLKPISISIGLPVFLASYGLVVTVPALIQCFKREFVTDYGVMSGLSEILGGIGGVFPPAAMLFVIFPCALHRRNWMSAICAIISYFAMMCEVLLFFSIANPLPFVMPSWLAATSYALALPTAIGAIGLLYLGERSEYAPPSKTSMIPCLLALLCVIAVMGNFASSPQRPQAADVVQNMPSQVPEKLKNDVIMTLNICKAVETDASIWWQLIHWYNARSNHITLAACPNSGPLDFYMQMRKENDFAVEFIREFLHIYATSPDILTEYFSKPSWTGRYNGCPMADALVSGLALQEY